MTEPTPPQSPDYADQLLSEPAGLSSLDALQVEWMGLGTQPRSVSSPQSTPFHLVMILTRGQFRYQIGEMPPKPLVAPGVLMVAPGIKNNVASIDGRPFERRYLLLSGKWLDEWVRMGWLPLRFFASPLTDLAEAEAMHHRLALAVRGDNALALDEGKLDLAKWLMRLNARREGNRRRAPSDERVRTAVEQWRSDLETSPDLPKWAMRCGLSVSRFRTLLRQIYGCSAHDLFVRMRVDHACCLLCERGDLLLKEVAYASGFKNVETFNRCVRRHRGMTPTALRNLLSAAPGNFGPSQ